MMLNEVTQLERVKPQIFVKKDEIKCYRMGCAGCLKGPLRVLKSPIKPTKSFRMSSVRHIFILCEVPPHPHPQTTVENRQVHMWKTVPLCRELCLWSQSGLCMQSFLVSIWFQSSLVSIWWVTARAPFPTSGFPAIARLPTSIFLGVNDHIFTWPWPGYINMWGEIWRPQYFCSK